MLKKLANGKTNDLKMLIKNEEGSVGEVCGEGRGVREMWKVR